MTSEQAIALLRDRPVPIAGRAGFFIRVLTVLEYDDVMEKRPESDSNLDWSARVLAAALCDENAAPIFTDPAQTKALPHKTFLQFFNAAMKVNSVSAEAVADEKKDCEGTLPNASGLPSPELTPVLSAN